MKPLVLLKWSFLLGSLVVALLPAPSCKAQEIVGDQFDSPNTEPFQKVRASAAPEAKKANPTTPTTKSKPTVAKSQPRMSSQKGQAGKSSQNRSAQILSASDRSQTSGKGAAVTQPKLDSAPGKPKDE